MKKNSGNKKKDKEERAERLWRAAAVLLALAVWQVLSLCVRQNILLPSPWQVVRRLCTLLTEPGFPRTVGISALHAAAGFLAGLAGGLLLGAAASRHRRAEILLQPWMAAAKSVPVAAVIVIFLIWISGRRLSAVIAALVVLPVVYQNTLTGCRAADPDMEEMADIFRFSRAERFRMVVWPALYPYLLSACRIGAGMAWKAGIAAEILGAAPGSIGREMYLSKTILDTETLLAWTVIAVLLSAVFEKLTARLLSGVSALLLSGRMAVRAAAGEKGGAGGGFDSRYLPGNRASGSHMAAEDIILSHISKSYGEKKVLEDLSVVFPAGSVSVIRGPSGAGKTTLLRLIMGLEELDAGTIRGVPAQISAVFQEDRLCGPVTALQNVLAGSARDAGYEKAEKHLREAGLGDSLTVPVSAFSGGMKRRTAIIRACLADGDLVLLDEPFAGLDPDRREQMKRYIERETAGKTVLLVSHEDDPWGDVPGGDVPRGNGPQEQVRRHTGDKDHNQLKIEQL